MNLNCKKPCAIGNIVFIWLAIFIFIGDLFVISFTDNYPLAVAIAYPATLTFLLFLVYFLSHWRYNGKDINEVEYEELNSAEKRQQTLLNNPIKRFIYFTIIFWIISAMIDGFNHIFSMKKFSKQSSMDSLCHSLLEEQFQKNNER
ncbi:hypothetical protein ACVR1G_03900 [Streptococcus dentasini]